LVPFAARCAKWVMRSLDQPAENGFCMGGGAGIAQLVEQLICNQQVVGSNPTAGSLVKERLCGEAAKSAWTLLGHCCDSTPQERHLLKRSARSVKSPVLPRSEYSWSPRLGPVVSARYGSGFLIQETVFAWVFTGLRIITDARCLATSQSRGVTQNYAGT
jgi:hypothetical protein